MVAISGQFGSFNALLNLHRAQNGQDMTVARLSDGDRIQQAADDPSGLAVSNRLRSEVKALQQLKRTHFEGVTAIQVADDNLEELSLNLARIAELATQASSNALWGNNSQSTAAMNTEYQQILQQIDHMDQNSEFNNIPLFGSSPASFDIPTDPDPDGASETITVNFSSFSTGSLGLLGTDLTTNVNAGAVLNIIDNIIEGVSRKRGGLAAIQKRLQTNMDHLDERKLALESQDIDIRSTDVATEAVNTTRFQILGRSNIAALAQTNLNPDRVFQLLN